MPSRSTAPLRLAAALFVTIAAAALPAAADDHPVALNASIQAAIDAADPGDRVLLEAGVYEQHVQVIKEITVEGSGSGPGGTVIKARPGDSTTICVPWCASGVVTIANLAVQGRPTGEWKEDGTGDWYCAVFSTGRMRMVDCRVFGSGQAGVMSWQAGGDVLLERCTITGCSPSTRAQGDPTAATGPRLILAQCSLTASGFHSPVQVYGKGRAYVEGSMLRNAAGCGVHVDATSSVELVGSTVSSSGPNVNSEGAVTIRGAILEGDAQAGGCVGVVSTGDSARLIMTGTTVRNHLREGWSAGVLAWYGGCVTIRDGNVFRQNTKAVDVLFATTADICGNTFEDNGRGVDAHYGGLVTVTGNTFARSEHWAVGVWGDDTPGDTTPPSESTGTITGNLIGACGTGVRVGWGGKVAASENTMQGNGTGVFVSGGDTELAGNEIRDSVAWGVDCEVAGSVAVGAGNYIHHNGGGISFLRAGTVIRDSVIVGNHGSGIEVTGCSPLIQGNTIQGSGGVGIRLSPDWGSDASPSSAGDDVPARPHVQGNTFVGNRGGGIASLDTAAANAETLAADNTFDATNGAFRIREEWLGLVRVLDGNQAPAAGASVVVKDAGGATCLSGATGGDGYAPATSSYGDETSWVRIRGRWVEPNGTVHAVGPFDVSATYPDGRTGMSTYLWDGKPKATGMDIGGRYQVAVVVPDTTPPTVTCSTSLATLWPPNHKMVDVGLRLDVRDDQDPAPAVTVSVTQNEPGDEPCAELLRDAGGAVTGLRLRAERLGGGAGRVYLILVTATDSSGHTTQRCCAVTVAKSQSAADRQAVEASAAEAVAACMPLAYDALGG